MPKGLSNITIETDSQNAMEILREGATNTSPYRAIVEDAKFLLRKPKKLLLKQGQVEKAISRNGSEEEVRDERKIDVEIEEIQMEIGLLSSSLENLWLEKAEQKLKSLERRRSGVKVVPSKFMEQQQSVENANSVNKIEEQSSMGSRAKFQRRGFSLGPEAIEIKS
ncbi:hypothetical protein HYC85_012141 [Camellia sinensis]|uniref:Uncharacterized protein n=1 Tax=Camellia sinensis TaxID=4442 RepID=A0A7J7HE31_CAMSI|nr:hypothetical protein HYC85_012141 [Camellia sinensis]